MTRVSAMAITIGGLPDWAIWKARLATAFIILAGVVLFAGMGVAASSFPFVRRALVPALIIFGFLCEMQCTHVGCLGSMRCLRAMGMAGADWQGSEEGATRIMGV